MLESSPVRTRISSATIERCSHRKPQPGMLQFRVGLDIVVVAYAISGSWLAPEAPYSKGQRQIWRLLSSLLTVSPYCSVRDESRST